MEVIDDIYSSRKEITGCISKHGSVREHNFWFFYNQQSSYAKAHFFKFNDKGAIAIRYKSGIWEIIGELLAPKSSRMEMFQSLLDYTLLEKKDKKMFAFVPENFWDDVNNTLQNSQKYKITKKPIVYYSPIFNLKKWDDNLAGKEWKKLRNIKNSFFRHHKAEFVPSKEIEKNKLMEVVHRWRKSRTKAEKTYYTQMHLNFIKNDFEGTDIARSIVVDNEPWSITAGWKIPNSSNYYSAIGLYGYAHEGLGEVANVDDLAQIKSRGYEYADFGDSTESLLQFKKKFGPESFYKTHWFHIVRK